MDGEELGTWGSAQYKWEKKSRKVRQVGLHPGTTTGVSERVYNRSTFQRSSHWLLILQTHSDMETLASVKYHNKTCEKHCNCNVFMTSNDINEMQGVSACPSELSKTPPSQI